MPQSIWPSCSALPVFHVLPQSVQPPVRKYTQLPWAPAVRSVGFAISLALECFPQLAACDHRQRVGLHGFTKFAIRTQIPPMTRRPLPTWTLWCVPHLQARPSIRRSLLPPGCCAHRVVLPPARRCCSLSQSCQARRRPARAAASHRWTRSRCSQSNWTSPPSATQRCLASRLSGSAAASVQ